nr:hypothetical protein [Kibdelosporangium sp. MJ126-NF4]CTQ88898.1 hypothetical protein [Kibdelosporangium sp. MJ126-NF4]
MLESSTNSATFGLSRKVQQGIERPTRSPAGGSTSILATLIRCD